MFHTVGNLSRFYLYSCPRPPSFYWKMLEKLRSVVFFKQYIMQCSCPSELYTLRGPFVKIGRGKKPKITELRTAGGVSYKNNSVKNMVYVFIFSLCSQKSWLSLWWYFPWCSLPYMVKCEGMSLVSIGRGLEVWEKIVCYDILAVETPDIYLSWTV